MALLLRHRPDATAAGSEPVPGLHAAMLGQGWQPAAVAAADGHVEQLCTQVALAMHRLPGGPLGLRAGPVIQGPICATATGGPSTAAR